MMAPTSLLMYVYQGINTFKNEKHFAKSAFIEDFSKLPFECLDRHAPIWQTKLTRPPAPWMKDIEIQSLQKKCKQSCYEAYKSSQNEDNWNKFRSICNQLKKAIKKRLKLH